MKYRVTLAVTRRTTIEVEAKNVQDAIIKAEKQFIYPSVNDLVCENVEPVITPVTPKSNKEK